MPLPDMNSSLNIRRRWVCKVALACVVPPLAEALAGSIFHSEREEDENVHRLFHCLFQKSG